VAAPGKAPDETIRDTERVLSTFLRHNTNLYLLIRPDRYILAAFSEEEIEQCTHALQQLFGGKQAVNVKIP
jgi:hypothetical protein